MAAPKPDVDGAKKLLAEAGYPNGFALTLATPNDRYINDAQISQAVAQMLTRVGLKVSLDAMTQSTFFARRNRREFGFWLAGWGSDTGEMSSPLKALIATPNKDTGMGATNPGGYSNAAVDATLQKALATVDDAKRGALLAEGEPDRDGGLRRHPAAFRDDHLGVQEGPRLHPARRPVHPGHDGEEGEVTIWSFRGRREAAEPGIHERRPRVTRTDGVHGSRARRFCGDPG